MQGMWDLPAKVAISCPAGALSGANSQPGLVLAAQEKRPPPCSGSELQGRAFLVLVSSSWINSPAPSF